MLDCVGLWEAGITSPGLAGNRNPDKGGPGPPGLQGV